MLVVSDTSPVSSLLQIGRAELLRQAGIPIIGLLGVLLLAKEKSLVASVKDCVVELQTKAGFYVAESLVAKALAAAGE